VFGKAMISRHRNRIRGKEGRQLWSTKFEIMNHYTPNRNTRQHFESWYHRISSHKDDDDDKVVRPYTMIIPVTMSTTSSLSNLYTSLSSSGNGHGRKYDEILQHMQPFIFSSLLLNELDSNTSGLAASSSIGGGGDSSGSSILRTDIIQNNFDKRSNALVARYLCRKFIRAPMGPHVAASSQEEREAEISLCQQLVKELSWLHHNEDGDASTKTPFEVREVKELVEGEVGVGGQKTCFFFFFQSNIALVFEHVINENTCIHI
jgi:hypothetical protein